MSKFFYSFLKFILGFGLFGVFLLSLLDSTPFFFMPFAIDAVLIILVSRAKEWMPVYAVVSAAGSVVGCLITYYIIQKSSEQTLEKLLPKKRFERVKRKLEKNAFWAMMLASMLPPPFPFTPFILMAGAVKYPKQKVVIAVAIGRLIRYLGEGTLAIFFGKQILRWMDAPAFKAFMFGLFALAIVGSIFTIYKWVRMKR